MLECKMLPGCWGIFSFSSLDRSSLCWFYICQVTLESGSYYYIWISVPLMKWCWKAEPSSDLCKGTRLSPIPSPLNQLGLAVAFENSALSLVNDHLSAVFHFPVCSLWSKRPKSRTRLSDFTFKKSKALVQLVIPYSLSHWVLEVPEPVVDLNCREHPKERAPLTGCCGASFELSHKFILPEWCWFGPFSLVLDTGVSWGFWAMQDSLLVFGLRLSVWAPLSDHVCLCSDRRAFSSPQHLKVVRMVAGVLHLLCFLPLATKWSAYPFLSLHDICQEFLWEWPWLSHLRALMTDAWQWSKFLQIALFSFLWLMW